MKMMMRHSLGSSAVAMTMAFMSGCIASGEPATGDEEGFESSDSNDETIGTARLALTSLSYSTYLGGAGEDTGSGTAVDSAGNVYVAGQLAIPGAGSDIFVSKLSPAGALIYSVSFGGAGSQSGKAIAVDSAGNAYVAGTSMSSGTSQDFVVAKLNAAGSALLYYTRIGGSGDEFGGGIAIDGAGNAYVTGETCSTDFPATVGAFQTTLRGDCDVFVSKLNASGNALVYSTFLGGNLSEYGISIAVDAYGYAYVAGRTQSMAGIPQSFPTTAGAFQTNHGGNWDAFVTELTPSGSSLYYSTYLGGSGFDEVFGIAVDGSYNAYVTGNTDSSNFPTSPGAFRTSYGGRSDGFVTKLNASGNGVYYSTYLGGSGQETGSRIAVNRAGNAYVVGWTDSTNFPTTPGAFRTFSSGQNDAFVTELSTAGSALYYSTYVGGSNEDFAAGIALDSSGNAYVGGSTKSTNFPTLSAAQPVFGGMLDVYVLKISGP